MAKEHKSNKEGTGMSRFTFDVPEDPIYIHTCSLIPFGARVKSIEVKYVKLTREAADAEMAERIATAKDEIKRQKRHDAAVKANATRKARKAESEAANG